MFDHKKIIALIPARGGSKGLPGKNIADLHGKPLIVWTIEAALQSQYIDEVYVSTDDASIAEVARQYGAKAPFLRPAHLASDTAKSIDAVIHAIDWIKEHDCDFDLIMPLQATSPLRDSQDINAAIERLFNIESAQAIVSVCPAEHPPHWINTVPESGCMKDFYLDPSQADGNRQQYGQYYRIHGAIDLGFVDYVKGNGSFLGPGTYAYVMSNKNSVDIDTKIDLQMAELLMKERVNERLVTL